MAFLQGTGGGVEKPTLLWTNDSPSTSIDYNFTANINGLSNYKAFMIEFRKQRNDSSNLEYNWIDSSDLTNKQCTISQMIDSTYWAIRPMLIDYTNNRITGNGKSPTYFNTSTASFSNGSAYTIPTRIWGYKKTIINT